jgi:MYXO-CTERM domain-containing protein
MHLSVRFHRPCLWLLRGARGPGPRAALAALIALLAAAPVRADQVTATFSNVNPGEVVTISSSQPPVSGSGWAGVYNFTNASGYLTGNYAAFCIDIAQDIYTNQTATFNVQSLGSAPVPGNAMGQLRANLIGELWYNDYAKIGSSNSNGAAFQLAVWEIINEQTTDKNGNLVLNVSSGSFSATDSDAATLTTANTWLAGLNLAGTGPQATNLIALTSSQYQDYVTMAPAPEPPGWVLGGMALVGVFVGAAWRRRRQHTAPLAA